MAKGVIPAPPDGFEIEASTPAPPAGFVLEDASSTPPEGFELMTDAPAAASTTTGLISAARTGLKRLTGLPDVLTAAAMRDVAKPSIRQERRAYEQAMNDPRLFFAGLQDPVRAEALFGPAAKLEQTMLPAQLLQRFVAEDVAANEQAISTLPRSAAQQELTQARTTGDKWKAWLRNPMELTATIALESLPPAIAGALAGSLGGPAGTAAGTGISSGLMTFSGELLGEAGKQGYDVRDATQLQQFLNDRKGFDAAVNAASVKAGIIAPTDAATAGAAGRFIGPALQQGLKQRLFAAGKELGMQMGGGMGGEAAGQLAAGQPLDSFDVLMEGIAELGSAPVEIASNLRGRMPTPARTQRPSQPKVFSEFGDEATTVPTREAKESGPAAATGKGTSAPKGESAPTAGEQTRAAVPPPPEGFVVEGRESKVEGQPEQTTVPELPATLHAQVVKMREGKAPAVLFTPADTIPEWALQDQRFDVVQTPEGRVMFDTAAWTKDEITRLVENNQMGTVLGYGVPNRPAQATGAVVVRDKAGLELRAVGVDEATAPAVLEAARRYAGEGDTVAIEPLENVISKRLDRTGAGADVRTIDAEAQAAAYAEGKRYREEQARQTVESRESRVESEAAPVARPPSLVTEAHLAQAREAVAQMRGEQVERAPDIFDDLDNVTKQPLRVPAELQDVIDASRERIAQELHQKTWKRLSSAQRKPIDRQLRVSTTEGMAADEVMPGLGEKYAGLTVDDLANAVLDAGEGRLLERKKGDSKEVLAMAEEIARAEAMRPAPETKGAKETNPEIDPWQETIDALDSLKLDTNGQLHAFGLLPSAWNTLIDIAKLAVKSGRALGDAIDYAIAEFKRRFPEQKFDAESAKQHLMAKVSTPEYAMKHRPNPDGPRAHNLLENDLAPRDIYESPQYYTGQPDSQAYRETLKSLRAIRGKPEATVKIYRAAPRAELNSGDWVSLSRSYAKQHGMADHPENDVPVHMFEVKAKDLRWPGDELGEFGYYPEVSTKPNQLLAALDSLKLDTNGQLHAFGLLPEAWNTLIDIAKLAVKSGRALGEAIDYAIAEFKRRFPDQTITDEAGARAALMAEIPTRATGEKIVASGVITDETKRAIQEYIYDPRSNRTDRETALGIVVQLGPEQATQLWRSASNEELPGAVRSKLLGAITQHLATAERSARAAGDTAKAEALMQQQAQLWDEALPKITNVAQELQAMNDLVAMTPDAHVARAKRDVQRAGDAELERRKGETDVMRNALEEGRSNGIEAVRQDAETNQAAREAVNEAIKNSAETQRGIVMELAQPWAQSEYVLNHAREAVRAKANELLNKQPRPAGFTPAQHLRQILDDLAARAAGIFAGHIQGSEPAVSLVDKLMQRLGVDRPQAVKLASSLSKEWDRQLELARSKLDVRLASARARQERREREAESNAAVDRALRRQLRELNLKLGDAIRQAASDRQRTGAHMADAIVQASGLTGAKADALRQRLQERYDELVAEAQRNALAAIENRAGVKVRGPMREAFDKLIEIDRLAPVSGDAFFKTVRAGLKLPELTEAQARQLRDLVTEAQTKPEGWQRQRVIAKALTLVEQAKGTYAWQSVPFSIWYANIFSAPPTHLANLIGNSIKALEVVGVNALTRPTQLPALLRSFARGVETGGLEAASIALTGNVEGSRLLKAEASRPLEARIAQGGWNKAWLPWAAVGRALAAEDVLFFKGHEEVKWNMLARRIAKEEGLRGAQLDARVQDLLHNTRAEYEAAKVQAAGELASGRVQQWKEKPLSLGKAYDAAQEAIDIRRRAHEIIEQRREASMPGSTDIARQFALEHTFNSQPYGVMGAIAETLNTMNSKLVVTRFAVPVVRIVANLANESLNYFPPVGLARVTVPRWRSDILERSAGDKQALEYATARAVAGTVLFGALAALVYQGANDPDAKVEITGRGPRSKNARTQLASTGWKPNAIRIGDRWYSYQESHLSLPLAILGNYSDAMKYEGMDQKDALNRVGFTMQSTLNTIFTQRMLSGVHDLIAMMDDQGNGKELGNFLARSTASFAVPNALRFVDQAFDPAVYEADDVKAALYAQTPFVRRQNRPALNALGEPVERGPMDRFTTAVKPDALMTVLAQKNAWIPMPNLDEQTVGGNSDNPGRPMSPDEYYSWIAISGPQIRAKLTENLDKLVSLTPDEAKAYVRKIAVEERRKTKPKE